MRSHSSIYVLCGLSKYRGLQKVNLNCYRRTKLNTQIYSRHLCSVSRVGFDTYEKERLSYKIDVPGKFNFASHVLDKWAIKEKEGLRSSSIPAFWFVSDNGKEYKLSFQELEYQTKITASMLENRCGIKRGDNVIVMLPKIPEFWLVNVASLRIGFVLCPCTMMLTAKDLAYRLSALKPNYVIAHESVADTVDEADVLCPTLRKKIIVSDSPIRRTGWHDFNRLQPESKDHKCAETNSDETMMTFFTSGTTGNPSMVEHSHASYGIGMGDTAKYWLDITSNNIVWNMSDTGWAKTAYSSFFGPWIRGACVFVHQMTRYCPKKALEVLSKYPVDTLCAPPLIYRTLLEENLSAYKFSKLEHCISGGESVTVQVIEKFLKATGLKIYEGYGQTETACIVGMFKFFDYRMGSIGKPIPGMEVRIVDENENELGPGIPGEIVVKRENSPVSIFKGYKNNPEQTKSKLSENYLHTGDVAYYDNDGYFWFVGRNDDLINSAGYRIGPFEVESALMGHPAVHEAAVISSPDPKRGEVVKAVIVLDESTAGTEELIKELQEHCKRITAPYKYPRKIEFVKKLPKTISGKVKRSELKRNEWKDFKK